MYNKMTMEVILSTAFGRAVDVQNGKGGKLLDSAVKIFGSLTGEGEQSSRIARALLFLGGKQNRCITNSLYNHTNNNCLPKDNKILSLKLNNQLFLIVNIYGSAVPCIQITWPLS